MKFYPRMAPADIRVLESELERALTCPKYGEPGYVPGTFKPRRNFHIPLSIGLFLGIAGTVSILMLIGAIVGLLTGGSF
jgi:hypothetical protein